MLAIVIPYYKISFFNETLLSLANQTNKKFRVYIGNDNSPQDPIELIKYYQEHFNITYKKFNNNLGKKSLSKQWERCIDLVKDEDWIMVLCDDDYLEDTVVDAWYKHFNEFNGKTKVVRFASQMKYEGDKESTFVYKHPKWEKAERSYYRKLKRLTRSSLSEHIFLKESYLKYKFYDYPLGWYSDDRAWLEFSENLPIYTINDAQIYIRSFSESISGKEDNLHLKRISSSQFFKYLVYNKLNVFSKEEKNMIIKNYTDRTLIVRNLKLKEWVYLFYLHINNFTIHSFNKFLKTFIKSFIN